MIPYGHQDITAADIEAVTAVLRSDFLTQGPAVPRFEELVATRVRVKRAVAFSSATAALHAACLALGLRKGDWLWTVPNTFVASANCGRYCGAEVDFVDIDPQTWDMSIALLEEKLVRARKSGALPKVVVPVHFAGQPTQQEHIWHLAKEFGFRVLEDASHSIGAARDGEPVGSCRWSDVTVFSFHPVKIVTTGEGGMALTNDEAIAERMAMLRTHGITRDTARFACPAQGAWYYEQQELGFNYRMTDIQAALGISQLHRLDDYIQQRNQLARRYDAALQGLSLRRPSVKANNLSAFHIYVVRLDSGAVRSRVFSLLRARDIGVNVHYIPVHLQPYYRQLGFVSGSFPEAEAHGQEALTLPLYPTLSQQDQDAVVRALREAL